MSGSLFTYGTLRSGHAPDEIAPAVEKLLPVGRGSVHGLLYDLGGYPGAILDPASPQKIYGTVSQLPPDENFLRLLDEYEGFDRDAPNNGLFIRTLRPVVLSTGRTLPCWIYVYNGPLGSACVVPDGRYLKKRRADASAHRTSIPAAPPPALSNQSHKPTRLEVLAKKLARAADGGTERLGGQVPAPRSALHRRGPAGPDPVPGQKAVGPRRRR
jgi:gamma-glutamylcyclotransferase (GGCT)/AIG2-like uncharacterized protein YtfP